MTKDSEKGEISCIPGEPDLNIRVQEGGRKRKITQEMWQMEDWTDEATTKDYWQPLEAEKGKK